MRFLKCKIFFSFCLAVIFNTSHDLFAQETENSDTTVLPIPPFSERAKKWGPNDTIITGAVWYRNEMLPYHEEENIWVSKLSGKKLQRYIEEWTRLRNAVYVTYPYARVAGKTINEINVQLKDVTEKKKRKEIIKSREKELRKQFTQPLENLSVYQGKILMKLINRQTGNDCYEILKEFKGGLNARMYQTVAFFFGSNLKQPYDATGEDAEIESIVKEVQRMYGHKS